MGREGGVVMYDTYICACGVPTCIFIGLLYPHNTYQTFDIILTNHYLVSLLVTFVITFYTPPPLLGM